MYCEGGKENLQNTTCESRYSKANRSLDLYIYINHCDAKPFAVFLFFNLCTVCCLFFFLLFVFSQSGELREKEAPSIKPFLNRTSWIKLGSFFFNNEIEGAIKMNCS